MTRRQMQLRAMFMAAFGFQPHYADGILARTSPLYVFGPYGTLGWEVMSTPGERPHATPTAALRAWCRACDAEDATDYVLGIYRAELARLEAKS